jgi:uncharacterized protein
MPSTPETIGLAVIEMLRAGRFAEIRDLFVPQLQPMVTAEVLQSSWSAAADKLGSLRSVGTPVSEPAGPSVVAVKVPLEFERGGLTLVAAVTGEGQLGSLQLAPPDAAAPVAPWSPPPYADPARFDEHDVTLGTGPLAVPATLSLPTGSERRPALLMLSGSGPLDRDETLGRNKPFKDLAWGLASRGVVVLRFDKVTHAHPTEARQLGAFTVLDEYATDVRAAVQLLLEHPLVDPQRIYLLGHSLGGTIAPRLAAALPSIAGLVLLAGGAQPLQWAMVRQVRYLASLAPDAAGATNATLETLDAQARRVDSADLVPSTPASELPLGVPASYWLDLRQHDPAAEAAAIERPMLILQGGRDYQVTVADDLARWQTALQGRRDVTVRVYPADNHMFFSGSGPSTPAEYEPAQHMDPQVVADVADWLVALEAKTPPLT